MKANNRSSMDNFLFVCDRKKLKAKVHYCYKKFIYEECLLFCDDYINEFVLAYNGDVVETARFNLSGVVLNENARETRRVRA